jgi:hypothetical protein
VVTIDYYVSTCPRQGLTRARPAGLFRCVQGEKWLSGQYLEGGKWRLSPTLVYELTSGLNPLERVEFDEAMAVLEVMGARPDSIDERARTALVQAPESSVGRARA